MNLTLYECITLLILFISVCFYYEFMVSLGIFSYPFSFLCLIINESHPNMLNWCIKWGKQYFCLSHFNPNPYWPVTYSFWSGSCLTFLGSWVAFHVHVCGYVITSHVVQFVITYNMPEVSFLAPLDWGNMITFLLPVTIWCLTIIFPIICHHMLHSSLSLLYIILIICHLNQYGLHEYVL